MPPTVILLAGLLLAPAMMCLSACGSSASSGGSDGGGTSSGGGGDATASGTDAGSPYATLCPSAQGLATCPAAPRGDCVADSAANGCAGNALPTRFSCSGLQQCVMNILPCPNEVQTWAGGGRVDAYICSCVGGAWTCADCYMGASLCGPPPEAGTPADASGDATDVGQDGGDDAPAPDAATVEAGAVSCQVSSGDAATVYTAGIGLGDDAGTNMFIVDWVDDAGTSQSCGFSSCPAVCPAGQACSVSYTAHALVVTGGSCL